MGFRDEISRPGFVIDLMTAIFILSIPVLCVVLWIEHVGWSRFAISVSCYLAAFGIIMLFKRLRARSKISPLTGELMSPGSR
jgi:hypothetical protein